MPIYEYQCESCSNVVEAWQHLADTPLNTCPSCSGQLRKLISLSSFQLKGGGWYADGYNNGGKNGKSKPCSNSSPCTADSSPCGAAKTDTCGTAKADTCSTTCPTTPSS